MISNFYSIDPVDNSVLNEYESESPESVLSKISKSVAAFNQWKNQSYEFRESLFLKAADILEQNLKRYSNKITE